jgi:glycosyltransferase involved in cell wall biosynthesis
MSSSTHKLPVRVFFLIRSLNAGGAERQLIELIRHIDKQKFKITVATFYDGGVLRTELTEIPMIKLVSLKKQGRWDLLPFFYRLVKEIRHTETDIVHGYLDVANIIALLVGRICKVRVVFGVRASSKDLSEYDWTARATYNLSIFLARFADGVIANSQAGLNLYLANGLTPKKTAFIPNGIDIQKFHKQRSLGIPLRAQWDIAEHESLVGIVSRLAPMKDYQTFLMAAAQVQSNFKQVRFVCIGDGPSEYQQSLQEFAKKIGVDVIWAGLQKNMPAVYNALDILVLSSRFGEGFPNVLAEGMACGIPCVATDVGDCKIILGETGRIVHPNNAQTLAEGIEQLLSLSPSEQDKMRQKIRQRIENEFPTEKMVSKTELFLLKVAG